MGRRPALKFNEKELSKGELRKLNALRKSLGDDIAAKAFGEWYVARPSQPGSGSDKNLTLIAETLQPLLKRNKLRIPRGGYIVRRGRGRVIVERPGDGE
jgi:hypothetical protein